MEHLGNIMAANCLISASNAFQESMEHLSDVMAANRHDVARKKNSGGIPRCFAINDYFRLNEKSPVSTIGSRWPPLMREILRPTETLVADESVPSGAPSAQSSR